MNEIETTELLNNPDVIKEIHQHLWIESEKAGYDIGLAWAAEDWMKRYAQLWLNANMPGVKVSFPKPATAKQPAAETPGVSRQSVKKDGTPDRIKKRRAKSYIR